MKTTVIALGRLGQILYNKYKKNGIITNGSYYNHSKGLDGEFFYKFGEKIPNIIHESDLIIFNLTPSVIESSAKFYDFIHSIEPKRMIFISSTSVYGNQGYVDEDDEAFPDSDSGILLKECENYLLDSEHFPTIIRPGGIYSNSSHPGNYLAGKELNICGKDYVNLVHIEDLSDLILKAINLDYKIINAVNCKHPFKEDYYINYCNKKNLSIPRFKDCSSNEFKIVNTKYKKFKITNDLP